MRLSIPGTFFAGSAEGRRNLAYNRRVPWKKDDRNSGRRWSKEDSGGGARAAKEEGSREDISVEGEKQEPGRSRFFVYLDGALWHNEGEIPT